MLLTITHFLISFASAAPSFLSQCDIDLRHSSDEVRLVVPAAHPERVYLNGKIWITGESYYPFWLVSQNLNLSDIAYGRFKGASVLTVGEGASDFLPTLLTRYQNTGAEIYALDLWYHTKKYPQNTVGNKLKDYQHKYSPYLIQGSALDLPVLDNSLDFYFSHKLVNNLDLDQALKVFEEAIRVIKPGGEARVFGLIDEPVEVVTKTLQKKYPHLIKVSTERKVYSWRIPESGVWKDNELGHLVTIKKAQ